MSLSFEGGPLSGSPSPDVNYELDGPAHKLYFQTFPRRVRIGVGDEILADTTRGKLLHETGILPVFYAPLEDIDLGVLSDSSHETNCPFKGDATYKSYFAGDVKLENLFWHYPDPIPEAEYLRDYMAPYRHLVRWWDEDEEIFWHLRDPYQRVDARASSRDVRVRLGDEVVAETGRPFVLSETGIPNRFCVPGEDVQVGIEPSEKRTHCPYKGDATWHSLRVGERLVEDAAWSYEEPFESALKVRGMLCFRHDDLVTEVDGETI